MIIGNQYPKSDWEVQRLGKLTSSGISALFGEPKKVEDRKAGKFPAKAITYINKKVAEILTGQQRSLDNVFALQHGNDFEPYAMEELQKVYPNMVHFGGNNQKFFPLTRFSGGSPDGIDFDEKIVSEIKCPENPEIHVSYMLFDNEDDFKDEKPDYWHQLQMNMLCVSRHLKCSYMDMRGVFASYYPYMLDEKHKLKIVEVLPSKYYEQDLLKLIEKAELMMADIVDKLM